MISILFFSDRVRLSRILTPFLLYSSIILTNGSNPTPFSIGFNIYDRKSLIKFSSYILLNILGIVFILFFVSGRDLNILSKNIMLFFKFLYSVLAAINISPTLYFIIIMIFH